MRQKQPYLDWPVTYTKMLARFLRKVADQLDPPPHLLTVGDIGDLEDCGDGCLTLGEALQ